MSSVRSPWPRWLVAGFLAIAGASDLLQVGTALAGINAQPPSLVFLHAVTGAAALAGAAATLRRRPVARALIWSWGVLCAALLLWVPIALELPREAMLGLIGSALAVDAIAAAAAWVVARDQAAPADRAGTAPATKP